MHAGLGRFPLWATVGGIATIALCLAVALLIPAGRGSSGAGRASSQPANNAGLVADSPNWDFGTILREKAAGLNHQFQLRNVSSKTITILGHSSTCGCTMAKAPTSTMVGPGATTGITIAADFSKYSGSTAVRALVKTDSPQTPIVMLTIQAFVAVPAVLSVETLNFGVLSAGEQRTREVELAPGTDHRPFRVLSVTSQSKNVMVRRLPPDRNGALAAELPGGPGRFAVTVTAPSQDETEQTKVVFHTDLPTAPDLSLKVTAAYREALRVAPQSVLFLTPDAPACQVRIDVPRGGGRPNAAIVSTDDALSPFAVLQVAEATASSYTIVVGLNGKARGDRFSKGVLRVTVDNYAVNVPIMVMGR